MSLFPPTPHVLLARHRTKAKIFYFNFREAPASLFSPLGSTGKNPVKKPQTEGAWPPSIAEERQEKQNEDQESRLPSTPSAHLPQPLRYLSLPMEGCLALLRVDPQGDIGIQMVQLLGAPYHQAVLPNLQRQPQSSILGIQRNKPTLPFLAIGQ